MSRTLTHVSIALAAALLTATPASVPAASAQEAITLETIGVVRMMSPAELHGRDAEGRSVSLRPVDSVGAGASPAIAR